ncbi:hypothetical protein IW262DRAFT_534323 [Armillaria fumosa]|nr:hypothetical protein IW262DRAFT_534323 [Armillaria fumosa]
MGNACVFIIIGPETLSIMDSSSRLPLEVLQKVFRYYLSDRAIPVQSFDHSDGLWVLWQVNSTWRCGTLSDSTFWSNINGRLAHLHDLPIALSQSNTADLPVIRPMAPFHGNEKMMTYMYAVSVTVPLKASAIFSLGRELFRSPCLSISPSKDQQDPFPQPGEHFSHFFLLNPTDFKPLIL